MYACVYVFICMWYSCVGISVYTGVQVYEWVWIGSQSSMSDVGSQASPILLFKLCVPVCKMWMNHPVCFWDIVFYWTQGSLFQTLETGYSLGSAWLCLPSTGVTGVSHQAQPFHEHWGFRLRASCFHSKCVPPLTEPPPKLLPAFYCSRILSLSWPTM